MSTNADNDGFSLMPTDNNCHFCKISQKKSGNWIDSVLLESENFLVVPSLGAMVEGWVLVIPKVHTLNFSEFYQSSEFLELTREILNTLNRLGKKVCMFEHGATHHGSLTGCGVDHAHVHFVPLQENIQLDITKGEGVFDWQVEKLSNLDNCSQLGEYLLYSNDADNLFESINIAHVTKPESQYFRKAIASKLNIFEQYDYKEYTFAENVEKTAQLFENKNIFLNQRKSSVLIAAAAA